MCKLQTLSLKNDIAVYQCMECRTLTFWAHHILLTFTPEQFKAFRHFTSTLDRTVCVFTFPNGEDRLILQTPHSDICFTFSEDEWEDFQSAMNEAEYMQDIYQLLRN